STSQPLFTVSSSTEPLYGSSAPNLSPSATFEPSPASSNSDSRVHTKSSSRGPSPPSSTTESKIIEKRQRNTLAARKYRQKRLDRIAELERALEDVSRERDDLRVQLARRDAEVTTLRGIM
ncbi:hypothetical protein BDY21DRAFT_270847, partial [Lineolata rhizophorae]